MVTRIEENEVVNVASDSDDAENMITEAEEDRFGIVLLSHNNCLADSNFTWE